MKVSHLFQEQLHKLMSFNIKLLDFLQCPKSGQKLLFKKEKNILVSTDMQYLYRIAEDIPILSVYD